MVIKRPITHSLLSNYSSTALAIDISFLLASTMQCLNFREFSKLTISELSIPLPVKSPLHFGIRKITRYCEERTESGEESAREMGVSCTMHERHKITPLHSSKCSKQINRDMISKLTCISCTRSRLSTCDGIGIFCHVYNSLTKCFVERRSCEFRKANVKLYNANYSCVIKESNVEAKGKRYHLTKLGAEGSILLKNSTIWVIFASSLSANHIGGGLG